MNIRQLIQRTVIAAAISITCLYPAHAAPILYASNFDNNTITAYNPVTGAFLGTPVTAGLEASGFNGVRIGANGSFFVTGQFSNNVLQYSSTGTLSRILDPLNTAGLDSPQDLVFGPDGNLYVASANNDKILKYNGSTGQFLGVFANLGSSGHLGPIDLVFGPDGNLYVTTFDNDQILKLNGTTGALLSSKQGPAGIGFGAGAFRPDGNFYAEGVNLTTFEGTVYRYNITTGVLSTFIPVASGGLQSPGGLVFTSDGRLLLANVIVDQNGADLGSTILQYNATTGAPMGTLVGAGKGLNVPLFLTIADTATTPPGNPTPEPSTLGLAGFALVVIWNRWRRRSMT